MPFPLGTTKTRYTAQDVSNWVDRHIDPDFYDFISTDMKRSGPKAPKVGDYKRSHLPLPDKELWAKESRLLRKAAGTLS